MAEQLRVSRTLQRIELNPVRPMSQRIESFVHELLHIVNNVYANGHLGEDDIDAISEGLLQILQQLGIEPDFSQIPEEEL